MLCIALNNGFHEVSNAIACMIILATGSSMFIVCQSRILRSNFVIAVRIKYRYSVVVGAIAYISFNNNFSLHILKRLMSILFDIN